MTGVVGHKRIKFSPDAIQVVDLVKRTTLQDLANALGMKKAQFIGASKKVISTDTLMTLSLH